MVTAKRKIIVLALMPLLASMFLLGFLLQNAPSHKPKKQRKL